MQQRTHIAPPICHLIKYSAVLLNLLFQHKLSPKRLIKTTGGSIRLLDPDEQGVQTLFHQTLYYADRQEATDASTMVRWEQIEEIDLPGIEGMVRAFWPSHCRTDDIASIILCDV